MHFNMACLDQGENGMLMFVPLYMGQAGHGRLHNDPTRAVQGVRSPSSLIRVLLFGPS